MSSRALQDVLREVKSLCWRRVKDVLKTNKWLLGSDLAYNKYVVSIKYHKLYTFDECKETIGGVSRSKHCTNILFPRNP